MLSYKHIKADEVKRRPVWGVSEMSVQNLEVSENNTNIHNNFGPLKFPFLVTALKRIFQSVSCSVKEIMTSAAWDAVQNRKYSLQLGMFRGMWGHSQCAAKEFMGWKQEMKNKIWSNQSFRSRVMRWYRLKIVLDNRPKHTECVSFFLETSARNIFRPSNHLTSYSRDTRRHSCIYSCKVFVIDVCVYLKLTCPPYSIKHFDIKFNRNPLNDYRGE
jgi:hypothetical protein